MNDFKITLEGKWTTMLLDLLGQSRDGPKKNVLSLEDEDEEFMNKFRRVIIHEKMKDADDYFGKGIGIEDPYLNMELGIRHNDEEGIHHASVKRRELDDDGKPMGTPSKNLLLYHRQYKVEFINMRIEILTANIIAENLLAQVDDNENRHLLIDEIEDHR